MGGRRGVDRWGRHGENGETREDEVDWDDE